MKIGIMGGTFDPIHIGHLLLGMFAYEDFGLDEIWFLPNGNPPHKQTKEGEEALGHRIEMVRRAISDVPYFRQRKKSIPTHTRRCGNYARFIRRIHFILFWEQTRFLRLKNGNIFGKFFRHARSLRQCGTIKMWKT